MNGDGTTNLPAPAPAPFPVAITPDSASPQLVRIAQTMANSRRVRNRSEDEMTFRNREDQNTALREFIVQGGDTDEEMERKIQSARKYDMQPMSTEAGMVDPSDRTPLRHVFLKIDSAPDAAFNVRDSARGQFMVDGRTDVSRALFRADGADGVGSGDGGGQQAQQPEGGGNRAHPLSIASIIRSQRRPRSIFAGAGGFPLRTR